MTAPLKAIGVERGDKVTRLEAFVDASFAFALTLLVISGDSIPGSIEELVDALKQIQSEEVSPKEKSKQGSTHLEEIKKEEEEKKGLSAHR